MQQVFLLKDKVSDFIFNIDVNDLSIITFLKKNIWTPLILHSYDEINLTYTVKESEHSKTFEFPASLFSLEKIIDIDPPDTNSNDDITNNDDKVSFIHKLKNDKNKIIIILITIFALLLLWNNFINSNASLLTTGNNIPTKQNDFDYLTQQSNENMEYISQELQYQKELRDKKRELNQLIDSSKSKVLSLEKENQEIRNALIHNAQ